MEKCSSTKVIVGKSRSLAGGSSALEQTILIRRKEYQLEEIVLEGLEGSPPVPLQLEIPAEIPQKPESPSSVPSAPVVSPDLALPAAGAVVDPPLKIDSSN